MASDRSRGRDRSRFGYVGVVAQQGRVVLDRDFNAQQTLTADRIADDALDFVGPCGTPDDGFRISLIDPSKPPNYWKPPVALTTSPPETPGQSGDFLIAPGTMYVGGQRVHFPPTQGGAAITYSYVDQPDWPLPPAPGSPPAGVELVYFLLEEMEISAGEDPDLLEVALGGPDTTQRLKLLRRIHRMGVASTDCCAAWQAAVEDWAQRGLTFDPRTMRLMPNVGLKVGFANAASNADPCDPVATGGYLGAENQLIRVRIDRSSEQPRALWGYDDASFLYRVASVGSDDATLTLAADPPDAFHFPQQGQWVEVLTTAAVLAEEPDESDPTGQSQILRVAAASDGVLRQAQQAYGPLPGETQNVLVVTPALPAGVAGSPLPIFVRVWQAALAIPANGQVILTTPATDPSTGTTSVVSTGVTATFSVGSGSNLASGLFWQIAVRPATPQGVYPEDLLAAFQPPDGPRRWVCPLAVIDWSAGTVADCRKHFDNLVALTRRRPGCCTVSIRPCDVKAATTLQSLIDRAASMAAVAAGAPFAPLTVCLEAGAYSLPGTLYLDRRHSNLTLEACGGPAILEAQTLTDMTPFTDGLIVLDGAEGVTLRGLELRPPIVQTSEAFYTALLQRLTTGGFAAAAQILRRPYTSFGVRALDSPNLTLDRCVVDIGPNDANTAEPQLVLLADLFGAAVFLQGNCAGIRIDDCSATSGYAPLYTPVAADANVASPAAFETFNRTLALRLALPQSPPPGSPPQSSPPSEASALDLRVSDALELVAAKRLAGDLTAIRFTVVTAAVLASGSSGGYCRIGDASISGSEFNGFTFGIYVSAVASAVRVRDNTIQNGVAGVWFETPNFANPAEPAKGTNEYYNTMLMFEEYQLLVALASAFPSPTPPRPPVIALLTKATGAAIYASRQLPPFALSVTDNLVQLKAITQTQFVGASAALRLALYREQAVQLSTSVIVSSNRLYGGARAHESAGVPAALVTLARGTPCSITGNVIANNGYVLEDTALYVTESTLPAVVENLDSPSLWVVVSNSVNGVWGFAATGNVLIGASDLRWLTRVGLDAPLNTWSPFNANPG